MRVVSSISTIFLACNYLAFAGGTVTNLTHADLAKALQGGGTVSFATTGTLPLTNTIVITLDTTLDANTNSHLVTISGGGALRLFEVVTNVSFVGKGLTLSDGKVAGADGGIGDPAPPGQDAFGAGILNQGGTVTLIDCTLSNNVVQGGKAGQDLVNANGNATKGGDAMGAALYNAGGHLNLTNCLLTSDIATGGAGNTNSPGPPGFFLAYALADGGSALGGAIYSKDGTVILQRTPMAQNQANGGIPGTGISSDAGPYTGGNGGLAAGAGIYATNSEIMLDSCSFTTNSALGGGADSAGHNSFARKINGSGMGGAVFISPSSSATLRLCSFEANSSLGGRGAKGGNATGGAIFNGGELQVSDSTFSTCQSTASFSGGAGSGGAICSTNRLVTERCTFQENQAQGGGTDNGVYTYGPSEGGAMWSSGVLEVTNCTFTANLTTSSYFTGPGSGPAGLSMGAGLCVSGGTVDLINVTVAGNNAAGTSLFGVRLGFGGGLSTTNSVVRVANSIIANSVNGGDVWGTVIDGGYNICSDGTAEFTAQGSLNQADPMLSALSQNGGPTPTMSLLLGSPARDAIPAGFPSTDQRGVTRPQGTAADIGAYEADFVSASPTILTQPASATVRAGTNVTFTVQAAGTSPLSYQWFKNSNPVAGATGTALSLSNLQAADAGSYSVQVTNAFGAVTSSPAVLVVDSRPLILAQPASVVISPGGNVSFSVSADGPSLSYQWWHDSTPLAGATSTTVAVQSATAGAQGNYFAVVTNFAGGVTSAPALLSFDSSALSILVPPKNQSAEPGYPATFSVLVSGIPPIFYQWQHNGTTVPNATNSTLTLASVSTNEAGSYNVIVTNGYAAVASASAQLTVTAGATRPMLTVARFGQSLGITFTAEAGRTYRLLSSTNFASWTAVATNSALNAGLLQFVQPIVPGSGDFYRVVTP